MWSRSDASLRSLIGYYSALGLEFPIAADLMGHVMLRKRRNVASAVIVGHQHVNKLVAQRGELGMIAPESSAPTMQPYTHRPGRDFRQTNPRQAVIARVTDGLLESGPGQLSVKNTLGEIDDILETDIERTPFRPRKMERQQNQPEGEDRHGRGPPPNKQEQDRAK